MGFYASELDHILTVKYPQAGLAALNQCGVHPAQIERLRAAAIDIGQVASLPNPMQVRVRQSFGLTPLECARLEAGAEADVFFRLLMYHKYFIEEAANKANAVFSAALRDRMAAINSPSIYPAVSALVAPPDPRVRRRGRRKKADIAAEAAAKLDEAANT